MDSLLLIEQGTCWIFGELEHHGSHDRKTSLGSFDRLTFSVNSLPFVDSPEQRYMASTSTWP
jgi:hypothetical protein